MSDETVTGWRAKTLVAWAWLMAHPVAFAGAAGLLAGLLLPPLIRWLL